MTEMFLRGLELSVGITGFLTGLSVFFLLFALGVMTGDFIARKIGFKWEE